jgi:hypothetical protein
MIGGKNISIPLCNFEANLRIAGGYRKTLVGRRRQAPVKPPPAKAQPSAVNTTFASNGMPAWHGRSCHGHPLLSVGGMEDGGMTM